MINNFELNPMVCASYFNDVIPKDFSELCRDVAGFPFADLSNEEAYHLVYKEKRGTDASKHAFLAKIALLHQVSDFELMVGIYYINEINCPSLLNYLHEKDLKFIPSIRCYLRNNGERLDFSNLSPDAQTLNDFFIREQSIDPHQSFDWKKMIYEDYLTRWLVRSPMIKYDLEEFLKMNNEAIGLLNVVIG